MRNKDQGFSRVRTDDLLVERIDSELVIYDKRAKQAHCLSPVAAAVFESADGRLSIDELAVAARTRLDQPVHVSEVEQVLAELEERELLSKARSEGISRRSLIRKTAVGSAVVAASYVTTLGVPTPASAASCGQVCQNNNDCPPVCPVCRNVSGTKRCMT